MKTLFLILLMQNTVWAKTLQDEFPMSNGTIRTCRGIFLDSGGLNGEYKDSENLVQTICPNASGLQVQLDFTNFSTENNYDKLTIYSGTTVRGQDLGTFMGSTAPTFPVSLDASGCLTVKFSSDYSNVDSGWAANISCVDGRTLGCPTATSPLTGESVSIHQTLNWRGVSGVRSYDVYFGTTPNPPLMWSNVSGTTYNPGELVFNEVYFWKVTPHNALPTQQCPLQSFSVGHLN